ncbi:hypothetical protein SK128_024462, partial [Halocaridina rubra]
ISSSSQVQWDPRIGFVLRNLAVQNSGYYECNTMDFPDQYGVFVTVDPETTTIPKPAITWEQNQHFVVGHGFRLTCNVILEREVAFHWTLPNPDAEFTVSKSISTRNSADRLGTLHILNATLKDSGEYKCLVTSKGMASNEETRLIEIAESLNWYINITSVPKIVVMEGEPLAWKAEVRAFPPDPEIIYRDWNGREIKESEMVATEHNSNTAESWLRINKTTARNFGNYTIEAILDGGRIRDSETVFVKVKSKPHTSMHGVNDWVGAGEKLLVTCHSVGFPLGNMSWSYKTCPDGELFCIATYERFLPESENITEPPPGNVRNISIPFQPQESGILRCEATNEHGSTYANASVCISDVGGSFVFRYTGEGNTENFTSASTNLDVIENDLDFHLLCGATKFNYKNVSMIQPETGLEMTIKESNYSRTYEMSARKVTKSLEGKYACLATQHGLNTPKSRELVLKVLDEKPVVFERSNMKPEGNEVMVGENEPLSLNCTVLGTPNPTILWFKDNKPLYADSDFFNNNTVVLSADHQRIYLKYVFQEHEGDYKCIAENRLNTIEGFLMVTSAHNSLSTGSKVGLAIAGIGIFILFVVVVYLVRRVKRERRFRKSFRQNELFLFEKGNIGQLNTDCTADEQAELLPYDPVWEVNKEDITLGKQLGAGAFGRVVKATVTGLEEDKAKSVVAIKMCKSQADQSQVKALALELKIMIHLGQHLNIVNLMGAYTVNIGKGELWILVEYCRFGNLLTFMHKHRNHFINQIDPSTGKIDLLKNYPDPVGLVSPTPSGPRGYNTGPVLDMDGYIAPRPSKFNLSSPPQRNKYDELPQSPKSPTGSSNGSFPTDGTRQHVDNPMYRMGIVPSVSVNPDGEQSSYQKPRLNSLPSRDTESKQVESKTHSSSYSDPSNRKRLLSTTQSETGSIRYSPGNLNITNTDMTTVPNFSLLSPLSPTDSNHTSEMGLDSRGNPFHSDCGIVPAVTAPFTTSDIVCWAWQVAQGMDYLSSRKVLHGDLAARNLLLSDDNVVKISDFGLSRDMYKKDVYMKKGDDLMPIKWMSIEAIRDRIFSTQSDVWAYGVTLWELFTLGSTPYPGIEVNKDFLSLIEEGHRMNQPKYANKEIYDILLSCWEYNPNDRPTFEMCADQLGVLMLPDLREQYATKNDVYIRMNEERFKNETDYLNMCSSPNYENLTKGEEESRLHYVNVGESVDNESRGHYLHMKSPDLIHYSTVGENPIGEIANQDDNPSKLHYLPMRSSQSAPSPMVDVFSPRPNDVQRFTYGDQKQENFDQLSQLAEEEEDDSQIQSRKDNSGDDLETEKSSLINSISTSSSKEDITGSISKSNSFEKLNSQIDEENTENNRPIYMNI